ncbi:hypothetical protein Taro_039065 [Colocasia esculenta]|nr:hypothetical protein [Colocasia esculenta]
MRIVTF